MAEGRPENERTFLGLTHNPFVEPQRGFFERGGRKTHLEQLRHLSEWSRRVLLVTGAEGVGKTTLYRELVATLEPRVKAARINAGLVNTGFEVLSAIAQGFGLAIPADANTQSLRMELVAHVEAQTAADRLCLALVDDAHLLDHKAVDSLIALAHECGLHLVFFGEVRMVPIIERAASAKGVGWQEIRLSGYGEADARDYLEWRFSQAKYRGRIPFTDNEIRDLVKLSEGLPGRINQMANVLLVKLEMGEGSPAPGGFPKLHAALLTLLVVAVALLYLVVGESGSDEVIAPADEVEIERLAELDEQAGPGGASASAEVPARQLAADIAPEDGVVADITVETPPPADLPDVDYADVESPSVSPEPEPEPESDVKAAPAIAADAVIQAAPAVTSEPRAEPAVQSVPPANRASEPVTDLPPGAKDTRWLLQQDPDYFTLQLVTVSSPESARAFVARQREPGEFTIYQLQRDGRILHVVLYGLFSSRSAAQAAADNLPAEVGQVQPWIRSVGQVQDAARLSTRQ